MDTPYAELRGATLLIHGRTGIAELPAADGSALVASLQEILGEDPDPTDDDGDNDPTW